MHCVAPGWCNCMISCYTHETQCNQVSSTVALLYSITFYVEGSTSRTTHQYEDLTVSLI